MTRKRETRGAWRSSARAGSQPGGDRRVRGRIRHQPPRPRDVEKATSSTASTAAGNQDHRGRFPSRSFRAISRSRRRASGSTFSMPTFSDPTVVTNPLFPVSSQESVLLLGQVDGEPFRTEVTLLPDTRIIEWQGQMVETLVSQYVAYLDGRIHEVAYDLYAQADDGSVWYFGEDVFNFADGVIVDTHGTWIAGKDGPAAMIMPADPKVGDVYRPENIPGLVFEEVTVKAVDQTLDGPLGPVEGGMLVEELHMVGTHRGQDLRPRLRRVLHRQRRRRRGPRPRGAHRRAPRAPTGRARDPVDRRARSSTPPSPRDWNAASPLSRR